MRFSPLIFTCFLVAGRLLLPAQLTFSSLDEVQQYALQHSHDLYLANRQIELATLDKQSAKGALLPSVSALFNAHHNLKLPKTPVPGELSGRPGETFFVTFSTAFSYNRAVTANVDLLNWQNFVRIRQAEAARQYAGAEKSAVSAELKTQVAQAYYQALLADKAVELTEEQYALAERLAASAEQKFGEGLISEIELNQAKIHLLNVQQELSIARESFIRNTNRLKSILNIDPATFIRFDQEIETQSTDNSPILLYPDPALEASQKEILQRKTDISLAKAAFVPTITSTFYWGHQQYVDYFGISFDDDDWLPNQYIELGLNIPLFTGFRRWHDIQRAEIQYEIAQNKLESLQHSTSNEDSSLVIRYRSSSERMKIISEKYRLLRKNVALMEQRFEAGLTSIDPFIEILEDFLTAEQQYLDELTEWMSVEAEIRSREP